MGAEASAIVVRPAVLGDRSFVLSLAARFAETRPAWRSENEVAAGTVRALARAFDRPRSGELLVVAHDGERGRVAFAFAVEERDFFTDEPHVHLSEIAALPGGTGAGRPLMAAVEAWARGRGSRYVSLHVTRENGARALYERLGFETEYLRMTKLV